MNLRTSALATAAAAVAIAPLGLAGPAYAESTTVRDGADATTSPSDLRTVTLSHRSDRVVVRTTFTDLRRDSAAGLRINLDTTGARPGPEYAVLSGLGDGSDYVLVRVRDWRPVGEPMSCAHRATLDWAAEVHRLVVARSCLGTPSRVRVGVWMRDHADASHPVTDWLLGPRRWTPWVARA